MIFEVFGVKFSAKNRFSGSNFENSIFWPKISLQKPKKWPNSGAGPNFSNALYYALIYQVFIFLGQAQFKSRVSKNIGDCLKLELEQCCNGNEIRTTRTQTCQCQDGYIAGQVRGIPRCVPDTIFSRGTYCMMQPCNYGERCENINTRKEKGWLCKNFNISAGKPYEGNKYLETKVLISSNTLNW